MSERTQVAFLARVQALVAATKPAACQVADQAAATQIIFETGWGTSRAFTALHNPAGIDPRGALQSFTTEEAGMAAYWALLDSDYPEVGATVGANEADTVQAQLEALGRSAYNGVGHYRGEGAFSFDGGALVQVWQENVAPEWAAAAAEGETKEPAESTSDTEPDAAPGQVPVETQAEAGGESPNEPPDIEPAAGQQGPVIIAGGNEESQEPAGVAEEPDTTPAPQETVTPTEAPAEQASEPVFVAGTPIVIDPLGGGEWVAETMQLDSGAFEALFYQEQAKTLHLTPTGATLGGGSAFGGTLQLQQTEVTLRIGGVPFTLAAAIAPVTGNLPLFGARFFQTRGLSWRILDNKDGTGRLDIFQKA